MLKPITKLLVFTSLLFVNVTLLIAQDNISLATSFIQKSPSSFNLSKNDVENVKISSSHSSKTTGISYVYLSQSYNDIPVYNAIFNLSIKNGKVFHSNHSFIPGLSIKAKDITASLSPKEGLVKAAEHLNLQVSDFSLSDQHDSRNQNKYTYTNAEISRDDIPVELVWLRTKDNKTVKLAWQVTINDKNSADWWSIRIDARSGEFIEKNNFTIYCNFGTKHQHTNACKVDDTYKSTSVYYNEEEHSNFLLTSNQYNVFDIPVESPIHGGRSIVSNPYSRFLPLGSGPGNTNGWHHTTDSTIFKKTRGNNVWSKEDLNDDNQGGLDIPGGDSLVFNNNYSDFGTSIFNRDASIVNIFYWSNLVHDVLYAYGFDEVAGNFQENNLERGGVQGDYLFADAQDGGGLNNANFATPNDGGSPRMQMYLWSSYSSPDSEISIQNPASIAGLYNYNTAAFSNLNADIVGELVLVEDNTGTSSQGCPTSLPYINEADVVGKIAMIDRGNCQFDEKAEGAEASGAIAVLICNDVAGGAPGMSGDVEVGIPVISFSKEDCDVIKMEMLSSAVNLKLDLKVVTPDGGFDNGIIAHEYGHGWSSRLTGGGGNTSCLSGDEQQGEGWSDYLTLMLTTDWSSLVPTVADANKLRTIGTYADGQSVNGNGIRQVPYSYDFSSNSMAVYSNLDAFSIPHGIGTVWCTILWDMTWEIILQDDFIQHDIWDTSNMEGNIAAFQLVSEGLKLQPCGPNFVTSRDAILAADQALFNGKYRCNIWRAFARRGVGVNAIGGSTAINDNTESYDIPTGIQLMSTIDTTHYVSGDAVNVNITGVCGCENLNDITLQEIIPEGMTYVDGSASGTASNNMDTLSWANLNIPANTTIDFSYQASINSDVSDSEVIVVVDDKIDSGSNLPGNWSNDGNWRLKASPSSQVCDRRGYFATDYDSGSDKSLILSFNTNAGDLSIFFDHRYDTEALYDGGVVELSSNGGEWIDLEDHFTQNGYNGFSSTIGRNMFTGLSDDCISSIIEIDGVCGEIRLRFRMLSDAGEGGLGWLIDNVLIWSVDGLKTDTKAIDSSDTTLGSTCACAIVGAANTTPVDEPLAKDNSINLYPNPSSGSVLIQSSNQLNGQVELTVNSIDGRTILNQTIDANQISDGYQLNLDQSGAGIYFVRLKNQEINIVKKIILR